jgi:hypothetical protein
VAQGKIGRFLLGIRTALVVCTVVATVSVTVWRPDPGVIGVDGEKDAVAFCGTPVAVKATVLLNVPLFIAVTVRLKVAGVPAVIVVEAVVAVKV